MLSPTSQLHHVPLTLPITVSRTSYEVLSLQSRSGFLDSVFTAHLAVLAVTQRLALASKVQCRPETQDMGLVASRPGTADGTIIANAGGIALQCLGFSSQSSHREPSPPKSLPFMTRSSAYRHLGAPLRSVISGRISNQPSNHQGS